MRSTRNVLLVAVIGITMAASMGARAQAVSTGDVVAAKIAELELVRDTWQQSRRGPTRSEAEALWERVGAAPDDIRVFRRGGDQDLVERYLDRHPRVRRRVESLEAELARVIDEHTDPLPLEVARYIDAVIAVLELQERAWRERGTAAPDYQVRQRLSAHRTTPRAYRAFASERRGALDAYLANHPEKAERIESLSAAIDAQIDGLE